MAKSTDQKLDLLTQAIEKLVAHPVAPVAPIAPILPIAPIAPIIQPYAGDHDLLTSFRSETIVELKTIKDTLVKMQEATSSSPTRTEHIEVVRIQADHETRTRLLESMTTRIATWGSALVVFIGIAQFVLSKLWK